MSVLEKDIQRRVVAYAKEKGFRPYKRTTLGPYGKTGDVDYEFNGPGGYTWFCEFKAPGKKPTPKQWQAIEELQALGYQVYVCDDAVEGFRMVDREVRAL